MLNFFLWLFPRGFNRTDKKDTEEQETHCELHFGLQSLKDFKEKEKIKILIIT